MLKKLKLNFFSLSTTGEPTKQNYLYLSKKKEKITARALHSTRPIGKVQVKVKNDRVDRNH